MSSPNVAAVRLAVFVAAGSSPRVDRSERVLRRRPRVREPDDGIDAARETALAPGVMVEQSLRARARLSHAEAKPGDERVRVLPGLQLPELSILEHMIFTHGVPSLVPGFHRGSVSPEVS